ncbi:hypothetical protein NMY22_g20006 [Coprinellus aureogranulatus]|nr:hypothetical protein NMY22_g20006 [Coprinellus aureogranulatus]
MNPFDRLLRLRRRKPGTSVAPPQPSLTTFTFSTPFSLTFSRIRPPTSKTLPTQIPIASERKSRVRVDVKIEWECEWRGDEEGTRRSSPTLDVDPRPPTNTSRRANADGTLDVDAWRYDVDELDDDQLRAIAIAADTDLRGRGRELDEEQMDAVRWHRDGWAGGRLRRSSGERADSLSDFGFLPNVNLSGKETSICALLVTNRELEEPEDGTYQYDHALAVRRETKVHPSMLSFFRGDSCPAHPLGVIKRGLISDPRAHTVSSVRDEIRMPDDRQLKASGHDLAFRRFRQFTVQVRGEGWSWLSMGTASEPFFVQVVVLSYYSAPPRINRMIDPFRRWAMSHPDSLRPPPAHNHLCHRSHRTPASDAPRRIALRQRVKGSGTIYETSKDEYAGEKLDSVLLCIFVDSAVSSPE